MQTIYETFEKKFEIKSIDEVVDALNVVLQTKPIVFHAKTLSYLSCVVKLSNGVVFKRLLGQGPYGDAGLILQESEPFQKMRPCFLGSKYKVEIDLNLCKSGKTTGIVISEICYF
jgi:hypothetical protein